MKVQQLRLDELGSVSRGRSRHRPRDASFLYGGPYPFVQTGDVKRAGLRLSEYSQTYSEAGLNQSRLWPTGTLCITIAANIAETAILNVDACFPDSVIGFVADPSKSDTRFVKYLFDGVLKHKLRAISPGAAQENLSQEKLLSLKFPVPELAVQQRVADVLSSYDDLIENNRRRIRLLEEAARLLYREWFVHHRFPGHEHVPIISGMPEGWKNTTLGAVVETNSESYGAKQLPEAISYIDIASVTRGRIVTRTKMLSADAPGRARRRARSGDVIWSNVRPNLRAYALIVEPAEDDVYSTGFTILRPMTVPYTWLYQFVTTENFVGHLNNHATGAGYPAVRPDDFERAEAIVPTDKLLALFHDAVEPSMQMISKLNTQSDKLAQARDLLLPRVMSGEIAL